MGSGIAQTLAAAGATVTLTDTSAERAGRSLAAMLEQAGAYEARGFLPAGTADAVTARSSAADSLAEAVAGADLVVEAVFEDVDLKREVLAAVEEFADGEAVLATNTSSIGIGRIATVLGKPSRFVGMHWFNPAQFVPGVEVIAATNTGSDVVAWLVELLTKAGKWPVVVKDRPGFVCNRLQFALFREAAAMVEEGIATPEEIDAVVTGSFGYRLPFFGPFAVADMAGLDVYESAYRVLEEEYGDRFRAPARLAALVADGQLGTKTGGGFRSIRAEEIPEIVSRRDRAYAELRPIVDRVRTDGGAH